MSHFELVRGLKDLEIHPKIARLIEKIKFNGEQIWSKIETGRFPQMDELVQAMTAAMDA